MTAHVLTLRLPSPLLGRDKGVNVVLPGAYSAHGAGHRVLYLLHGYGGNKDTWLVNTRLVDHLAESGTIVVLPQSGRRWFVNDHAGLRYEDHLIHELVPAIDERFNTLPTRAGRAVGGFSMGGATALFLGLRHPALFGAVASHAGAFEAPHRIGDPYATFRGDPGFAMPTVEAHERVWGPPGSRTRRRYDPYRLIGLDGASPPPALYLDVGTEDHGRMLAMNRRVRDALYQRGHDLEYHERPGGHDWQFVDRALPASLEFVERRLAGLPSQEEAAHEPV
ncbi:alpha/beta hydrolase [Streptomyces sp. MUM 178J]|uniref:alpha/beta hydrolase n=1 Tax=Streptomyces sp. MUM 178J TaxID=2791991 RepID=UPI001F04C35E|nr:alpha/beta hydrolase family protein [Streptomyces sp. MUM 178J]WRQ80786.1 alpha/beta hydrolase family protein [Streptomyces sp. MUM 178J]